MRVSAGDEQKSILHNLERDTAQQKMLNGKMRQCYRFSGIRQVLTN